MTETQRLLSANLPVNNRFTREKCLQIQYGEELKLADSVSVDYST